MTLKFEVVFGLTTLLSIGVAAADEVLLPYIVRSSTVTSVVSLQEAMNGELARLGVRTSKKQVSNAANDCAAKLRSASETQKSIRCGSGDLIFRIPLQQN